MTSLSKKLLLIACLFAPAIVVAKKTKHLQIIVNANDPSYFFQLNAGNGLQNNPGDVRPQGSYFVTNGFIFPGDTVNKRQESYLVDRKGHEINFERDSIGMFVTKETMLQTLDFVEGTFPERGTVIEMSEWQLHFKEDCHDERNVILAEGFAYMNEFTIGEGRSAFIFNLTDLSGLGCNVRIVNNTATAKVYISGDGQSSLINIEFEHPIDYKD